MKVWDRVKLSPSWVRSRCIKWQPSLNNPEDSGWVIVDKDIAGSLPFKVVWDTWWENDYDEEDLVIEWTAPVVPESDGDKLDKIIEWLKLLSEWLGELESRLITIEKELKTLPSKKVELPS